MRRLMLTLSMVTVLVLLAAAWASPPAAWAQGAWWQIGSEVAPTNLAPGHEGTIVIALSDLGDEGIDGATNPVTITDTLPAGLTAVSVSGGPEPPVNSSRPAMTCTPPPASVFTCTYQGALNPGERLALTLKVKVEEPAGTLTTLPDQVSVQGGGASSATSTPRVLVTPEETPFGIQGYSLAPLGEDGAPERQAGAHPFELTTTLVLNQLEKPLRTPVALPKDLRFVLPPGVIGNPNAVGQCSMTQFVANVLEANLCPASSVVGVTTVSAYEPIVGLFTKTVPVFNLTPSQGEPARLGFEVIGKVAIVIDTAVQSDGDYAVEANVNDATQTAGVLSSQVTLWGVPGAASHDNARGWECVSGELFAKQIGKPCPQSNVGLSQTPFLTLPTHCPVDPAEEPVRSFASMDSWLAPESFLTSEYEWADEAGQPLGFEECDKLPFKPAIHVSPEQHTSSTPTGLSVNVLLPQQGTLEAKGLGEADVRDTTVTLPAGLQVNPSAATGLQACSEAQMEGEVSEPEHEAFKHQRAQQGGEDASEPLSFPDAPAQCPEASKVGSVRIKTPLLSHELHGWLYLAEPAPNGEAQRNPFNSLIALYLVAEDPVSGILVKLAGEGTLDKSTGQVSTTFRNTPQVPFEELHVSLFGGERAPVSTPPFCGAYSAQALFTPWSSPTALLEASPPEEFQVTSGPGGGPCPSDPLGLAPAISAQSTSTNAAAFTSFSLEIARAQGDQQLSGLTVRLPQGVSALLSKLTPCQQPPKGVEWSCGPESRIGHTSVISGLGDYPVTLPEGNVYLTSGYDGAPFGLLVQTEAKAGPFDLGNVNVRSRINVDPQHRAGHDHHRSRAKRRRTAAHDPRHTRTDQADHGQR